MSASAASDGGKTAGSADAKSHATPNGAQSRTGAGNGLAGPITNVHGTPPTSAAGAAAAAIEKAVDGNAVPEKQKRWRDWWLRLAMTLLMIGGCFVFVYVTKQPGVVVLIFILQANIYRELVQLALSDSKEKQLPGFSLFYWYWFLVCAFFMYVKTCQRYLLSAIRQVAVEDVDTAIASGTVMTTAQAVLTPLSLLQSNSNDASDGCGAASCSTCGTFDFENVSNATSAAAAAAVASVSTAAGGLGTVILSGLDWVVSRYEIVAYTLYMIGWYSVFVFVLPAILSIAAYTN